MKHKLCAALLIFFLSSLMLFSADKKNKDETKPSIIIEPEIGALYGTIYEKVWYADMTYSGSKLSYSPSTLESRLDWQLSNTPYSALGVYCLFGPDLHFYFGYRSALSRYCGYLEDYDWLVRNELTNYSIHTIYLNSAKQFDFLFGKSYNVKRFKLTPSAGIKVQSLSFAGEGGYRRYKSEDWAMLPFGDVTVITYNLLYAAPCLAFDCLCNYYSNGKFGIEQNFYFSASYIKTINAYDEHLNKSTYFKDVLEHSFLLQAETKLYFKINSHNKIGLKAGLSFMPDTYGFTFIKSSPDAEYPEMPGGGSLGGSSRLVFNYGLVYSLSF